MYNRILNRPMFKLGGKTDDAQGTGITSGLDTPRNNYAGGGTIGGGMIHGNPMGNRTGFEKPSLSEQFSEIDVSVPESTRKRAFWSGIGEGFSNARTLGEALSGAVKGQSAILGPAEAKAAERGFELQKEGITGEFEKGTLIKLEELRNENRIEVQQIANKATATAQKLEAVKAKYRLSDGTLDESNPQYRAEVEIITSGFNLQKEALVIASKILANPQSFVDVTDKQAVNDFVNGVKALILSLSDEMKSSHAKGGRIGYQFGTTNQGVQPVQASLNVDETIKTPQGTVQEDVSVQEQTQSSIGIPYQEFRAKMPAEVDDEIVQLIYYNEDAFADFAQIKSQAEVYEFNNKWGVSLVLPMDTETT